MGDGYRTFAAGEVLTAANVMGYLQEQAVMAFANAAARDAAITSPEEGMHAYLKDTNETVVYSGSAWGTLVGSVVMYSSSDAFDIASTTGSTTFEDTDTVSDLSVTLPTGWVSMDVMLTLSSHVEVSRKEEVCHARIYNQTDAGAIHQTAWTTSASTTTNLDESVSVTGLDVAQTATTVYRAQYATTTAALALNVVTSRLTAIATRVS